MICGGVFIISTDNDELLEKQGYFMSFSKQKTANLQD